MLPLYDDQPTKRFPFVTILVILANALVFVGWQLQIGIQQSVDIGGLIPVEFAHAPYTWSLMHMVSAMFMHAGWMHLVGNMWFLWIFGNNIEDAMGSIRFVAFYLVCGVIAALAHVLISPDSETPMIGASGAVSGVLGAYLVLHPAARITTFVPLGVFMRLMEIPAWVFLAVWIGVQILSQAASGAAGQHTGGGVAYLAHIGGFFAGMILIFFFKKGF